MAYQEQEHSLWLDLTGDDSDHSNGEVVYINSVISPKEALLLKCNDNQAFSLSFHT